MDTVVSPAPQSSAHIPASQTGIKPCLQRSCRGVMLYFPPHRASAKNNNGASGSWRSSEPVCLGLSSARSGPALDLKKVHEAREVPAGSAVTFSLVLGHAVYESSDPAQMSLPPGCMKGLEFVRFSNESAAGNGAQVAPSISGTEPSIPTSASTQPSYLASFANSFRILTSDADANARIGKTWASIVGFDMAAYLDKFQKQASKNMGCMSKWVRNLQDAISKPKS